MLKVNVPAGTIVTKDMIVDTEDPVTGTDRIQEYNMILLPSHLKNGDYVDIRMTLTNGQDLQYFFTKMNTFNYNKSAGQAVFYRPALFSLNW